MARREGYRGSPVLRQKDKGSLARENSLSPPAGRMRRIFDDEDERELEWERNKKEHRTREGVWRGGRILASSEVRIFGRVGG